MSTRHHPKSVGSSGSLAGLVDPALRMPTPDMPAAAPQASAVPNAAEPPPVQRVRELYVDGVSRLMVRAGVAKLDLFVAEPVLGPEGQALERQDTVLRLLMPAAALGELLRRLQPAPTAAGPASPEATPSAGHAAAASTPVPAPAPASEPAPGMVRPAD